MKTANCPYCGSDTFHGQVMRADAVNPNKPEEYAKRYGHWFNQCISCDGWSIHRDGKQFEIPNKSRRPKPYSEPALD